MDGSQLTSLSETESDFGPSLSPTTSSTSNHLPHPSHNSSMFQLSRPINDSDSIDGREKKQPGRSRVVSRSSGACVHCKSLKVRCEFNPGEKICQRCQAGNYECLPRSRKKRKPAPTHEDLQEKSYNQDRQIQTLLLQFDNLKTEQKIKEWMTKAHSEPISERYSSTISDMAHPESKTISRGIDRIGRNLVDYSAEMAATSFFRRSPEHESTGMSKSRPISLPDIVKYCSLYPNDIMDLFDIFFERVNSFFSILDPELHTPERLIWSSPFLFTVICAIAARYHPTRPNLYYLAQQFTRNAAGKALIEGEISVDICQAYLLMAVYPVPKKRWAEDKSWMLMGVAIRMAIELELDNPPPFGCDERESLNRTRTWLNCFCVDGSHSIQFGKMSMSSSMNIPFDVHLCAYVDLILRMAEWKEIVERGKSPEHGETFDPVSVAIDYDGKLSHEMSIWTERYAEESKPTDPPICLYRGKGTQLITAYLRLVVLSSGFQDAVKTGLSRDSLIVTRSMDAARTVIAIMTQQLYPTGSLRLAMDASFLYVAFAAAFLINFLRPKFLPLLSEAKHREIIVDVRCLISVLDSTALDGRHTPALYARFLSSLLAKYDASFSLDDCPGSPDEDVKFVPQYRQERQQTPPNMYTWPDTSHLAQEDVALAAPSDSATGMIYQQSGEADMDFSLTHFIRTVTQDGPQYPSPQEEDFGHAGMGHWSESDMRTEAFEHFEHHHQPPNWPPPEYTADYWDPSLSGRT